jgi:alpha-aminoadipate/glutamate carrier protein LysW
MGGASDLWEIPQAGVNVLTAEAFAMAVVCPECDNPIVVDTDEVEEGEAVTCDECGLELEVVSVDPLELAPVDVAGYDDEDDTPAVDEDEE